MFHQRAGKILFSGIWKLGLSEVIVIFARFPRLGEVKTRLAAFLGAKRALELYEAFLSEDKNKALLHGHSYSGNALGCAAALANLELLDKPETINQIENLENRLLNPTIKVACDNFFVDCMRLVIDLSSSTLSANGFSTNICLLDFRHSPTR